MLFWFITIRLLLAVNVSVLIHYMGPAVQSVIMLVVAGVNFCLNLVRPYRSVVTSIAMFLLDATYLTITAAFCIEEIGVLSTAGSDSMGHIIVIAFAIMQFIVLVISVIGLVIDCIPRV